MKKFLVATALIAALPLPALAADTNFITPYASTAPAADTFSWSGAYLGAHGSYGWGKSDDINNPDSVEQKIKGGFGGLQAGYNWHFGNNIVLGAEADISFGSVKEDWAGADIKPNDPYWGSDQVGLNGTIRARLGYAIDRFLPYATGGLAWAKTEYKLGCAGGSWGSNCYSKPAFSTSASKNVTGWTAGVGGEYAFSDNWTFKIEYLYKDFGTNSVQLIDPNIVGTNKEYINDRRFKTSFNEFRVGLNYRF